MLRRAGFLRERIWNTFRSLGWHTEPQTVSYDFCGHLYLLMPCPQKVIWPDYSHKNRVSMIHSQSIFIHGRKKGEPSPWKTPFLSALKEQFLEEGKGGMKMLTDYSMGAILLQQRGLIAWGRIWRLFHVAKMPTTFSYFAKVSWICCRLKYSSIVFRMVRVEPKPEEMHAGRKINQCWLLQFIWFKSAWCWGHSHWKEYGVSPPVELWNNDTKCKITCDWLHVRSQCLQTCDCSHFSFLEMTKRRLLWRDPFVLLCSHLRVLMSAFSSHGDIVIWWNDLILMTCFAPWPNLQLNSNFCWVKE